MFHGGWVILVNEMSLSALAEHIFTDSSAEGRMKTIAWLQRRHLLANRMSCNVCGPGSDMRMVKRDRLGTQDDKWAWRCPGCTLQKLKYDIHTKLPLESYQFNFGMIPVTIWY